MEIIFFKIFYRETDLPENPCVLNPSIICNESRRKVLILYFLVIHLIINNLVLFLKFHSGHQRSKLPFVFSFFVVRLVMHDMNWVFPVFPEKGEVLGTGFFRDMLQLSTCANVMCPWKARHS